MKVLTTNISNLTAMQVLSVALKTPSNENSSGQKNKLSSGFVL